MLVSEKGQVTIPKHIRIASGVVPGSQVSFSLGGGRIVVTPVASHGRNDRRGRLRAAAARIRGSLSTKFRQLGAQGVMDFLRGADVVPPGPRRGRRWSSWL